MEEASDAAPSKPLRVFLICRVCVYSSAIAGLLGTDGSIALVGTADRYDQITARLEAAAADVVLWDIGSPGALEEAERLIRERPRTRILGFGVDDAPANVIACAQAGLWGYVPCTASITDLVAAARRVASGDTVCSAAMANGIFRHLRGAAIRSAESSLGTTLTRRQQQIVRLIGEGLSNKEIARRLSLGNSTVKNHVHDILDRLQVSRRTEAAAWLRRPSNSP